MNHVIRACSVCEKERAIARYFVRKDIEAEIGEWLDKAEVAIIESARVIFGWGCELRRFAGR
jgi:hypothetical protein